MHRAPQNDMEQDEATMADGRTRKRMDRPASATQALPPAQEALIAPAGGAEGSAGRRGGRTGTDGARRGLRTRPPGPGRALARPVAVWAVTRAVLLLCVFKVVGLPGPDVTGDITVIYQGWYEVLRTGTFPLDDVTWQYPPAAALPVLSPALLPFLDYSSAFFVLACLADATVLALLLRAGRAPGRQLTGAWVWVAGAPLLGPTAYARYDVMVTAVAVAALLALRRHPRTAGALMAFGALLKVWPVLLLAGVPRGGRTRACWRAAAATGGAVVLLAAAAVPGAFGFLTAQRDRGTEVESLGALVFHVARHFGWEGRVLLNYGSVEFLGPYVTVVSRLALALTVAAFGWLLLWRLRAMSRRYGDRRAEGHAPLSTPYDAAFAAVLLFTTTSRVISPQYMLWLVGLAAVCLTLRGSRQGLPAVLVLAATATTLLEFPVWFSHVVASDLPGIALLALRNGLLVAATLVCCRRLWLMTSATVGPARRPGTASPGGSAGVPPPEAGEVPPPALPERPSRRPTRPVRRLAADGTGPPRYRADPD
ncbi:glycosyltransferase 87 family protein [Streptomyces sp. 8N706]|uniref:glycosyltransferase 87 family protein n=1 Tax=Streptomyces sp. 8N706 TaxID=3457416 RepID=UPI003FD69FC0